MLLVPACWLMLLAGCADDSAAPGGAPAPATGSVTMPPAPEPSVSLVPPSKGAGPALTLRGTVTEGVEAGCLLLTSGGVVYELHGAPVRDVKAGQQVEVDGRVDEGMLSTCQQGKIFTVTAVRPI